jgi:hypothetical protein
LQSIYLPDFYVGKSAKLDEQQMRIFKKYDRNITCEMQAEVTRKNREAKLFLCLIKQLSMQTYGRVQVTPQTLLTSALYRNSFIPLFLSPLNLLDRTLIGLESVEKRKSLPVSPIEHDSLVVR